MSHINETMLIGVGGVGSHLLQPLAALLASDPNCHNFDPDSDTPEKRQNTKPKMVIVDGDKYEEKNLRNQCITPADVGTNKAEYAATLVSGLVQVDPWAEYIEGPLAIQSWLVGIRAKQKLREDAGLFGGVALIIIPVDNDHCRSYVYKALLECPNVSVLVVDPSNGAGDDADVVDVVTYLRVYQPETGESIEPWPSPLVKYAQLQDPQGRPSFLGCGVKVESQPQLRTSNMLAATLTYDCVERFLNERGMVEGWMYSDARGLCQIGSALPTAAQVEELNATITGAE
jgi:hypothetical protein